MLLHTDTGCGDRLWKEPLMLRSACACRFSSAFIPQDGEHAPLELLAVGKPAQSRCTSHAHRLSCLVRMVPLFCLGYLTRCIEVLQGLLAVQAAGSDASLSSVRKLPWARAVGRWRVGRHSRRIRCDLLRQTISYIPKSGSGRREPA
jgi:hypothetical protein